MTAPVLADALRPLDWPVRVSRSVAAALVCAITAAVGHLSAGGAVSTAAVVTVFVGAGVIAGILSARRLTAGQLFGLLVLCQVVSHLGFSDDTMTMGPAMLVAHAVATLLSAVVLMRGETFAFGLAERLGLRVHALLTRVIAVRSWRPLMPATAVRSLRNLHLAHSRFERGPPVGSV